MAYSAEISRINPTCFLFLIDQSGSMSDPVGGRAGETSKAEALATTMNRLLQNLIIRCSKDNQIWRYFEVGVLGYGARVGPVLGGKLNGRNLVWIDEIFDNPARVEDRIRKVSDGAGGLLDMATKFPVWMDPVALGGTPMCKAFELAYSVMQDWVREHSSSFPPVVINITDGESTDGDPSDLAASIRSLETDDGSILLLNCHLSSQRSSSICFPSNEELLPDGFASMLYRMSSKLPSYMKAEAERAGYNVTESSRGFFFNAGPEDVIGFLDIGTRPSNLR